MNVISQKTLRQFWKQHQDAEAPLRKWYKICRKAQWRNLDDVQQIFPHDDAFGTCTIFNIRGNKYRLISKINYAGQAIYIKRVMTHSEYDREKWKNEC